METAQVFHPETISRQGERNAWILTGLAIIIELALSWRAGRLTGWLTVLAALLLLSAILISLSNWIDRKTILILEPGGVKFRNRLRNIQLNWDQVEWVRVMADRWGKRVSVSGPEASFNFRMLSELEFRGKSSGMMGFPEGETILKAILKNSGLILDKRSENDLYYARP